MLGTLFLLLVAMPSHDMRVCTQSYYNLLCHVQCISLGAPSPCPKRNRGGADLGELGGWGGIERNRERGKFGDVMYTKRIKVKKTKKIGIYISQEVYCFLERRKI